MAYITREEEKRYDLMKSKHRGLAQLLNILLTPGLRTACKNTIYTSTVYSEKTLIKNIDLIVDVIGSLPLIDGAWDEELTSIMKDKIDQLDKARERYETRLAEINKQLEDELKDIPEREKKVASEFSALHAAQCELSSKKFMFNREKEKFEALKQQHEEEHKKIMEFETPEGRDRARLAVLYLEKVPNNDYTDKAIAWSLGAIYSGGQIPNFGKKE